MALKKNSLVTAKAAAKKGANGVKKIASKRGAKLEEENLASQIPNKKSKKPVKEILQSSEDESGAEEDVVAQNENESDSEPEGASDLIDEEAEEGDEVESEEEDEDDDEDEDEEGDDDEIEPGQVKSTVVAGEDDSDEDDDEPPTEEVIAKKDGKKIETAGKKEGIPKIPSGRPPPDTPSNQILYVVNLPPDFKHSDVVALFTKFGPLLSIQRLKSKLGNNALVSFETAEGANAALAAQPKALTLNGKVLSVTLSRDTSDVNKRTVVVGLFGPKVTKEDLRTFFEKVGQVEEVVVTSNRNNPKAFVRFVSIDDIPKALKLHNSELFSRFITVRSHYHWQTAVKTPELTLVLDNTGKYESYNSDTIEKIFQKFGDIEFVEVVCTNSVLAFIKYKEPESITKALTLNGTTVDNLVLKLSRFEVSNKSILITNLASDATESDIREVFQKSGEIDSVQIFTNKALVKFTTEDGFCRSFLLNEHRIKKQPIFIEPNSLLKHAILRKRIPSTNPQTNKFGKRPFNKRPQNNNYAKPFAKRPKKF
ncbi:DNA-binding protein modulo [Drosophila bipectinata]|uniref:DNA-binding protein modulo n=1 Tax=Drosophila bipectinata TaxID=42026 RepID=UPI001C89714B|nr:DNA-binding protein modulo [Drosophila bipectinata]